MEYNDCKLVTEYSKLFGGGKSQISVIRIHGIKDSERVGLDTFEDCGEDIANYLSGAILAGHNIRRYDIPMIEKKLETVGFKLENIEIIDTLDMAKRVKIAANNKLQTLCEHFGIVHGGHRGLSDAKCNVELLVKLIELLEIKDVNEIISKEK